MSSQCKSCHHYDDLPQRKRKGPQYFLNKALYYYYNQQPNYNPKLKPCAYRNVYQPTDSYYDPVPSNYYKICKKINL